MAQECGGRKRKLFSGDHTHRAFHRDWGDLCPRSAPPAARDPRHLSRGRCRTGRGAPRRRGPGGGEGGSASAPAGRSPQRFGRLGSRLRTASTAASTAAAPSGASSGPTHSPRGPGGRSAQTRGAPGARPPRSARPPFEAPAGGGAQRERSGPRPPPAAQRASRRGRNFLKGTGGRNPHLPGACTWPPGPSPRFGDRGGLNRSLHPPTSFPDGQ